MTSVSTKNYIDPIKIKIRHLRTGDWNRHESAAHNFVQARLNQAFNAGHLNLPFEKIQLFLEFSDRNGKRKIGPLRRERPVVSAKVELDWRDCIDAGKEEMEHFIAYAACRLIMDIIAELKCDPSNFTTALALANLPARLIELLEQSHQADDKAEVVAAGSNMTLPLFWKLIEITKTDSKSSTDLAAHADEISARLREYSPGAILDFQIIQYQQLARAYTWELWAVAYLVLGGCSDNCFEEFRACLLSMGQYFFDQCIDDPQFLVNYLSPLLVSEPGANLLITNIRHGERILLAASHALEQNTGWSLNDILTAEEISVTKVPSGAMWNEDRICSEFPHWCAQLSHNH